MSLSPIMNVERSRSVDAYPSGLGRRMSLPGALSRLLGSCSNTVSTLFRTGTAARAPAQPNPKHRLASRQNLSSLRAICSSLSRLLEPFGSRKAFTRAGARYRALTTESSPRRELHPAIAPADAISRAPVRRSGADTTRRENVNAPRRRCRSAASIEPRALLQRPALAARALFFPQARYAAAVAASAFSARVFFGARASSAAPGSTNSIRHIGALSPRRLPSLIMRV